MIAQTSKQGETPDGGRRTLQWIQRVVDELFNRYSRQTDTRRAAILGLLFGLLMCVIVLMILAVFGLVTALVS